MRFRPAQSHDLAAIIDMTRAIRKRLASWSPIYFNPREGADEAHAMFLEFAVDSDERETNVVDDDEGAVVGFFQLVRQRSHVWVDDLCVVEPSLLAPVAELLAAEIDRRPWVTCVSTSDRDRALALTGARLDVVSSYWSRSLDSGDALDAAPSDDPIETDPAPDRSWSRHTFGGAPFDHAQAGALVVADADRNVAVGSPGVEPPIFDPGGPTTVVDHLGGPRRDVALALAIGQAAARNDAQLVVVAASDDAALRPILETHHFTRVVDLYALA